MMHGLSFRWIFALSLTITALATWSWADDGVKSTVERPPKDVPSDVAAVLDETRYEITANGKHVCDLWVAKQWAAKEKFTATLANLYPLEAGELVGVIRFPKKAADYRKQQIRAGVYTLRYGLQPEDGNHVGTSTTRDFLVLLPLSKDTKPDRIGDVKQLFKLSAEVSRSTHPAILALVSAAGVTGKPPSVGHHKERELWTVRLAGKAKAGERVSDLPLEFVVLGHAPE